MNVFDLFATLSLDTSEYEAGLSDAEQQAYKMGEKIGNGLQTTGKVAGKAIAAGAAAAAAGVVALTKTATSAYAEQEQLVGGIETLFGAGGKSLKEYAETAKVTAKDIENSPIDWEKYANTAWMENGGISALFSEMKYNIEDLGTSAEELEEYLHFEYDLDVEDAKAAIKSYQDALTDESVQAKYESAMVAQETVLENAKNAYKSAGMSANDYMDTVIGMAGALNKATGDTEESAKLADMAITDMSDNVNKLGTSIEMVQNAYTGFSRGNFTMLDNLALGFAGTKEGMQQLLDKAEELSGVDYNIESYADIVQAIHVVQEEMGIAGTTAKEAGSTIQGSMGAMKAAWDNLVVSLASGDGIDSALDNLVTSAETALTNIMPVVEQSLVGIADLLAKLAPVIAEKLPTLMDEILPPLIEAVTALLQGLIEALPTILQILIEALPSILETVINTVLEMLPLIIDLALQLILTLADGLIEALPELIPAIVQVIMEIVTKLTEPETLAKLIEAAIQLIIALQMGMIQAIPELIKALPEIISNIVRFFIEQGPTLIESGLELMISFISGMLSADAEMLDAVIEIIDNLGDTFGEMIDKAVEWGKDLMSGFIDGIKEKWGDLKDTMKNTAQTVKDFLGFSEPDKGPLSNFHTYAPDMMDLFIKGIQDNENRLQDQLNSTLSIDPTLGEIPTSDIISVSPVGGTAPAVGNIRNTGGTGGNTNQQHTVILELDKVQLGKVIYTLNNQETQRMGVNLAGGLA